MGYDKYKRYSVLAVKDVLQVSAVATYRNTALAVNTLRLVTASWQADCASSTSTS